MNFLAAGLMALGLLAGGFVARRLAGSKWWTRVALGAVAASGVVFASVTWLVSLLLAAWYEPWPISLRQGPDTDYARGCFERRLGAAPAQTFSGIYCREEWGFGGDSIYSIRFEFTDDGSIVQLAERYGLRRIGDGDRSGFRYLGGPAWWPDEAALRKLRQAYAADGLEYLWVDSDARAAYFQRAGF